MQRSTLVAAALLLATPTSVPAESKMSHEPARVVQGFLDVVRSGRQPGAVARYFAPQVRAHQVTSEGEATVVRTPAEYAAHVMEFITLFGPFDFQVIERLADGDRVYVRWRQRGRHLGSINGERPTGEPLTEISSAVYRVENGRIVEYWIQTDRKGLDVQLARLAGK
jgi:predicted ester cyclase